jgi:hypothetical protein
MLIFTSQVISSQTAKPKSVKNENRRLRTDFFPRIASMASSGVCVLMLSDMMPPCLLSRLIGVYLRL